MKGLGVVVWAGVVCALTFVACNGDGGSEQAAIVTASPSADWSLGASATPTAQTMDIGVAYTRDNATSLFIRRRVLDVPAGQEQEVPLPDGCGQVAEFSLAPGATKLALVCHSQPGRVYVMDLGRLDYVQVAEDGLGGLRWSPDGLTLAYQIEPPAGRAPSGAAGIRLVSSDGTDVREILPPRLLYSAGPWSPDGKSILITTCLLLEELHAGVWITEQYSLEDQEEPRVVAHGMLPVDWALRGGEAILGEHDSCPEGTQHPQPWVVELPFGDSYAIGPANLSSVGWLYHGDKAVLFRVRSPETLAGEIWLADRAGQWQLERVLVVPDGISEVELAPDERSILYVDWSGALYVWDLVERGEPRLVGRDAVGELSTAFDHTAD